MADWRDIPLITQAHESIDDVQTDMYNATMVDVVPVQVGDQVHLVKRHGLEVFIDLQNGIPIDGLYWHDPLKMVLYVNNGSVLRITDPLGSQTGLGTPAGLIKNSRATFAMNSNVSNNLIIANGGPMVYIDAAATTETLVADADAPTAVSHVAALDQYIVANKAGTGSVYFSAINDLTNWTALDFFGAEYRPDHALAINEGFREIIVLGSETVEFWINDGQTPFARIPGSAQPFGTSAKHSLALVGSTWMWLDHLRRFATMQGRQVVTLHTPYDRTIQRYATVEDAVGYAMTFEGMPLYVLNFPNAGETLVFNYLTQHWHKWGYWNAGQGRYDRYRGMVYCYAKAWNMHLVGDHSQGTIYKLSRSVFTDNGNPIRSLLRTGHVSHGISADKISDCVRLRVKRGMGSSQVENPQIVMRRRVNNRANWGNERARSLGRVGQHYPFIAWKGNGLYKTCQYEFVHSDNTDLVIMGAQELVTVLG